MRYQSLARRPLIKVIENCRDAGRGFRRTGVHGRIVQSQLG
jgi:hypothetical protein